MVLVPANITRFGFSPCKKFVEKGPCKICCLQGLKLKRDIFVRTKTIF